MENQHRKISGYRELSQEEIDLMNEIKAVGPNLDKLVRRLENMSATDKRWVEYGKIDLQRGLMALVRSIAQPTTF